MNILGVTRLPSKMGPRRGPTLPDGPAQLAHLTPAVARPLSSLNLTPTSGLRRLQSEHSVLVWSRVRIHASPSHELAAKTKTPNPIRSR